MTIFFDLDGPILDVSEKYYSVYCDALRSQGFKPISKGRYWKLKQNKVNDRVILAESMAAASVVEFKDHRNSIIETQPYMLLDRVRNGAQEVLERLHATSKLVLVTLRSSRTQLIDQLQHLKLTGFFTEILSSGEDMTPRWKIKYNLIRNQPHLFDTNETNWLVGDTETDILAGQSLNFQTIAVLGGIRSELLLRTTSPSFLIKEPLEILDILC